MGPVIKTHLEPDRLFTVREVVEYFSVLPWTILIWIDKGGQYTEETVLKNDQSEG